jgi:hypothetical protein
LLRPWTSAGRIYFHGRVGIEDFLWTGAVGGIASVIGELLLKERLATMRSQPRKRHYAPFVVVVVIFTSSSFGIRTKTIYNTVIAFSVRAVVIALLRSDLVPSMLVGALSLLPYISSCFSVFSSSIPASFIASTTFPVSSWESTSSESLSRSFSSPQPEFRIDPIYQEEEVLGSALYGKMI